MYRGLFGLVILASSGQAQERGPLELVGTVTRDGKAVNQAQVQLFTLAAEPAGRASQSRAASDASGRFTLPFDGSGWGFVAAADPSGSGSASKVLHPTRAAPTLTLQLQPVGTLVVRVKAPRGAPAAGAEVRVLNVVSEFVEAQRWLEASARDALSGSPRQPRGHGVVASEVEPGVFSASGLGAGPWWLTVRAPGCAPVSRAARVEAARTLETEVVLQMAAPIEGRITDLAERPLPGAQVLLSAERATPLQRAPPRNEEEAVVALVRLTDELDGAPSPVGKADSAGNFVIDEHAPARVLLEASAPGFFREQRWVTAPARGVQFALRPSGTLDLRVSDAAGNPVRARFTTTPTDACPAAVPRRPSAPGSWNAPRGSARLGPLDVCPLRLRVEAPGFVSRELEVEPTRGEERTVELVLLRE